MEETSTQQFGQYQLLEKIAQGGMAEIFLGKARDLQGIEKPVVIKRILPQIAASSEFVEMLIDEAKIAVMLSHGNIAQIYDLGKVVDDYFIVMEYVEGRTVSQIMKRLRHQNRRMPIPSALWIAAEIASGLDYMHRKTDEDGNPLQIIHRDISPQNIILSTSGTVKIIDFGIAKAKTKVSTTDSGVLKGKFAYMSPEHAEGEKLDHRTDIYSLGVVLYELLTGQRLFKGKNNQETLKKVRRAKAPPPSAFREQVTADLDQIVLKAIQKDRTRRYATAQEFHLALTRYLVSHHHDFSPRLLAQYLGDLFPELVQKIAAPPEGPITETKKPSEAEESPEETAHARSDLLRKSLEAEAPFEEPPPAVAAARSGNLRKTLMVIASGVALIWGLTTVGPSLMTLFKRREAPPSVPIPIETKKSDEVTEKPPPPQKPPPAVEAAGIFLEIQSVPSGATIFLNDQETKLKTPALLTLKTEKTQKIGLHLERHRFWEGTVKPERGKTIELRIPLALNFGDLEINSLPAGAEIYLNGQRVGETPFQLGRLAPGTTYNVTLKRAGFEDWHRPVKIFGGKKEVINASLKKIPKSRALR